jgi:hypothetical protein
MRWRELLSPTRPPSQRLGIKTSHLKPLAARIQTSEPLSDASLVPAAATVHVRPPPLLFR